MGSEPLKRYEIQSDYESWYAFERDDGDYVLHADAAAKIADLERQLTEYREAVSDLYKATRSYVYESSRFEPDNTYQAAMKVAVDKIANAALEAARRTK